MYVALCDSADEELMAVLHLFATVNRSPIQRLVRYSNELFRGIDALSTGPTIVCQIQRMGKRLDSKGLAALGMCHICS